MNEIIKKIDEEIAEIETEPIEIKNVRERDIWNNGYDKGAIKGLKTAEEIIQIEQKDLCKYTLYDDESNTYECSKCRTIWELTSGMPKENGMSYCPACGREINQPVESEE